MYEYLKEHAYISKNKKSNYQFELTQERAECIANKHNSLCVEKDKEIERLHSIIKEVREILKYHLSNPSGTKNGWHIDIWNSEDINKLNEFLEILDKENKKYAR